MGRVRRAAIWFILGTFFCMASFCVNAVSLPAGLFTDDSPVDSGPIFGDWDLGGDDSSSWDFGGDDGGSWDFGGDDSGSWDFGGDDGGSWDFGGDDGGSWDSGGSDSGSW
jgi:hypothetical protein